MTIENLAIEWQIRLEDGTVDDAGLTGGKLSWLCHEKHGLNNMLMRAKFASGLGKFAKTSECKGDGDVCRKLEDGRTIHIWRRHDVDVRVSEDLYTLQSIVHAVHDDATRDTIASLIAALDTRWQGTADFMR